MNRTDITRYLDLVRRRWQLIFLIVAAVLAASLVQSLLSSRTYEATSRVIIAEPTAGDVLVERPDRDINRALQAESRALESQELEANVARQLRTDPDVRFATSLPDELLITAKAPNASEAAVVANTYAASFVAFRRGEAVARLEETKRQLEAETTELEARITSLEQTLAEDPANRAASVVLDGRLGQQADFLRNIDELDFLIASETGGLAVGPAAVAPGSPVSPRPVRGAILALMLGSILALGAALAAETVDDTVRTSDRLTAIGGGAPVLGVIPAYTGEPGTVASIAAPRADTAEAYRALRTAVLAGLGQTAGPIIQVTSSSDGEGKSVVSANLAVTIAQTGMRVAVIDADLRNPTLTTYFPELGDEGLSEILSGRRSLDSPLAEIGVMTILHGLSAGGPVRNPAELLSGLAAKQLFNRIASQHDVTIVDSPGALRYADANIVASLADLTLVVARAGHTSTADVERTFDTLGMVGVDTLGMVLTDSTERAFSTESHSRRGSRKLRKAKSDGGAGDGSEAVLDLDASKATGSASNNRSVEGRVSKTGPGGSPDKEAALAVAGPEVRVSTSNGSGGASNGSTKLSARRPVGGTGAKIDLRKPVDRAGGSTPAASDAPDQADDD